jgi:hypothetical protein
VPKIPDSTKNSLHLRLVQRARARWPELADVRLRYRAAFAYVDGVLADGEVLPLCRLRYLSRGTVWGFAIYRASHDDYEDNYLPGGSPTAAPRRPSTAPAVCTSTTPKPGQTPTFQRREALALPPAMVTIPPDTGTPLTSR